MTDDERRTDQSDTTENQQTLNLDGIVATQPELGPSIPDGGWGWIVFLGTLFFQALVPCLIINFGVFLAFTKLENGTSSDKNIILWEEKILYVPLFFSISHSFFDSFTRSLAARTTTPRLIAVVGTCLTCAGLLFMWMGMTGNNESWLFVPAGILSGLGASIVMTQCEIILAQYFRLKLPILTQISQCVATIGFLIAPVTLGHYILGITTTSVLLWYQAIILQGLIVALAFKKPPYLKSKRQKPYQFVLASPEDEEDIFSKNSRELQIKRQTSIETEVVSEPQPSTSSSSKQKEWQKFNEESADKEDDRKYAKLQDWEVFDEEGENKMPERKINWERFEDEPDSPRIINELSFADETKKEPNINNGRPSSLFSDFPVNNNDTYAFDDELVREIPHPHVFVPNTINSDHFAKTLNLLKQPSFYKTLLMLTANRYSSFVFYVLFPAHLYVEADSVNIKQMTGLLGALSLINLIFFSVFYWINIDKKKRPICFWILYWLGSVGYFMISDFTNEYVLLIGAVQIIFTIGALDFTAKPLLGISAKGETSHEYFMLTILSSLALFLFVFLNVTFKTCFRLVASVHFFTGTLWLANFVYKRICIT